MEKILKSDNTPFNQLKAQWHKKKLKMLASIKWMSRKKLTDLSEMMSLNKNGILTSEGLCVVGNTMWISLPVSQTQPVYAGLTLFLLLNPNTKSNDVTVPSILSTFEWHNLPLLLFFYFFFLFIFFVFLVIVIFSQFWALFNNDNIFQQKHQPLQDLATLNEL